MRRADIDLLLMNLAETRRELRENAKLLREMMTSLDVIARAGGKASIDTFAPRPRPKKPRIS